MTCVDKNYGLINLRFVVHVLITDFTKYFKKIIEKLAFLVEIAHVQGGTNIN